MVWRLQTNGTAYTKGQGFELNHIQSGEDRETLVKRALRKLAVYLLDEESEVITLVVQVHLAQLYPLRPRSSSNSPSEPAQSEPRPRTTRKSRSSAPSSGSSSPTTTPEKDEPGSYLSFDSVE